jgi:hypothetical protein
MIGSLLARPASRAALTASLVLVLISCGGRGPREHTRVASQAARRAASVDAARRLLEGNGIGSITFGQPRAAVTAELTRLLGARHETIPGLCGFGRSTDWIGLNIDSRDPGISAQLTLNFKHSRFVGYAYFASAEGPTRQRHGVLLATSGGLSLGNAVRRARQLYGQALSRPACYKGPLPPRSSRGYRSERSAPQAGRSSPASKDPGTRTASLRAALWCRSAPARDRTRHAVDDIPWPTVRISSKDMTPFPARPLDPAGR